MAAGRGGSAKSLGSPARAVPVPGVAASARLTASASGARAGLRGRRRNGRAAPPPAAPSLPPVPPPSPSLPPPSPRGGDRRACNLVPFARLEQHLPPSPGTLGSHPKPYEQPKTNPGPHANAAAPGEPRAPSPASARRVLPADRRQQSPPEVPTAGNHPEL